MSYPLTGLSVPDPTSIDHPRDTLGQRMHDRIPYQLPLFPFLKTSWVNSGDAFHEAGGGGMGYNPMLLLSMRKSLVECIHKGGLFVSFDFLRLDGSSLVEPVLS